MRARESWGCEGSVVGRGSVGMGTGLLLGGQPGLLGLTDGPSGGDTRPDNPNGGITQATAQFKGLTSRPTQRIFYHEITTPRNHEWA